MNLFQLKSEHDRLLVQAIDLDTGEVRDEEALKLFESLDGALADKAIAYAVVIKQLEAQALAISEIAKPLHDRCKALEHQAARLRESLGATFKPGDKFTDPRAEVKIREGALRSKITDEAMLPEGYVEQRWVANRAKILSDLRAGIEISGAELERGEPIVSIK